MRRLYMRKNILVYYSIYTIEGMSLCLSKNQHMKYKGVKVDQ